MAGVNQSSHRKKTLCSGIHLYDPKGSLYLIIDHMQLLAVWQSCSLAARIRFMHVRERCVQLYTSFWSIKEIAFTNKGFLLFQFSLKIVN